MEPDLAQQGVDEREADATVADATAAETSPAETSPDELEPPRSLRGRIGHTLSGWRQLGRIAWRDPEHVAERLTLYSAGNLGEASLEWAANVREQRPEEPRAVIAEELRTQTAQVARIDGAVWDAVPDRADPRIPLLPARGRTHGASHRCPLRPGSPRA